MRASTRSNLLGSRFAVGAHRTYCCNHGNAGRDSLLIEVAYRLHHDLVIDISCPQSIIKTCRDHALSVLGGLYKLDMVNMQLESIYWGGEAL
jgi:hypothetical protein